MPTRHNVPDWQDGDLIPASVRRRAYPVGLAVIALLVTYGLLDGEQSSAWANLVAALVGLGTTSLGTAYRPEPDA